jgi:hypothetical protein
MQFLAVKKMKRDPANFKTVRRASLYGLKDGAVVYILTERGEGAPCEVKSLPPFPSRAAARAFLADA